jgi:GDP/UDP-N,N'-diacetylbacillosamine 2-epimerase (hydrolysing)
MIHTTAYISGTRADFGLMSNVLGQIQKHYTLDLYVTGMHLAPEFGRTVDEVRRVFPGVWEMNAHSAHDGRESVVVFASELLGEIGSAFRKRRPDIVFTLGDRPEMVCVAMACLYLGIPTAHFHGGDTTGTVDEVARHAITKLSHIHFAATKLSAKRILAMGEEKWRVHVVGAPSLDYILHKTLPTRKAVSAFLKIDENEKYLLVLQHPVSEEISKAPMQIQHALRAAASFQLPIVVIYPSSDPGGRAMIARIEKEKDNPQFRVYKSIPYDMFLALQKFCTVFIGNSSAGMIESSSFRIPVVNIGTRQQGREHGGNVISVGYGEKEIRNAVRYVLENSVFQKRLKTIRNPWGDGTAGKRIISILKKLPDTQKLLSKRMTY